MGDKKKKKKSEFDWTDFLEDDESPFPRSDQSDRNNCSCKEKPPKPRFPTWQSPNNFSDSWARNSPIEPTCYKPTRDSFPCSTCLKDDPLEVLIALKYGSLASSDESPSSATPSASRQSQPPDPVRKQATAPVPIPEPNKSSWQFRNLSQC
jgi:hypothetical protein